MTFEVTILGSNAAVPAFGRHPSAQVLNVNEQYYLIDCGEGTQIRMNDYNIRRHRINQIFISHLHGDHIFGLIGLLTSYSLGQRKEQMEIFGPEGIQEFLEVQLRVSQSYLTYDLKVHVVDPTQSKLIFSDKNVEVTTIPLDHRIPACGYLFQEKKRLLNVIPEKLIEYGIDFRQINEIKKGGKGTNVDGKVFENEKLTLPPYIPRTFAYCSDTAYKPDIIPIIEQIDLLYHEATFTDEKAENAIKTKHSTAKQAAMIAKEAKVEKLLIGHFSSRYHDLKVLLDEAKLVFSNTELALEGTTFSIGLRRIS
jgi:ribonuclease Z